MEPTFARSVGVVDAAADANAGEAAGAGVLLFAFWVPRLAAAWRGVGSLLVFAGAAAGVRVDEEAVLCAGGAAFCAALLFAVMACAGALGMAAGAGVGTGAGTTGCVSWGDVSDAASADAGAATEACGAAATTAPAAALALAAEPVAAAAVACATVMEGSMPKGLASSDGSIR